MRAGVKRPGAPFSRDSNRGSAYYSAPMWAAFLTTILYSFSALFAQRTARVMGGITANFWRLVLATLLLGLWSHLAGIGLRGPALPWFFLSGIVGFGVGDVALYQAYPRLGSRLLIMVVHCLATPTAALVEFVWLGAALSPSQVLCIVLSLSGVAVAVAPAGNGPRRHPQFLLGLGYGMVAMLGQALGAVLTRKANTVGLAAGGPLPDGINAAYQRIWGGLLVAAATFLVFHLHRRLRAREDGPPPPAPDTTSAPAPAPPPRHVLLWVVCNSLAGPVLGVSCFQWALRTNPTGLVLPIVALTPLMIIPVAHWMEGERTTRREILGGLIAVAGVVLLARITHPT